MIFSVLALMAAAGTQFSHLGDGDKLRNWPERRVGVRQALFPGLRLLKCTHSDSAQCSPPRECDLRVTYQALGMGAGR